MPKEINKTAEELELEKQNADAAAADDQGDDADEDDGQIDYEAELKLEREKRKNAETAAADAAFKLRESKRGKGKNAADDEDEDDEDEDKPLTRKELEAALHSRDQRLIKSQNSSQSLQIARGLTTSQAEAELAVEYYNNRIVPSGNLEEDMEIAVAAVNRKKLIQDRSEALRALGARNSRTTTSANGERVPADQAEPKVSADEARAFKSAGYKWNAKNQRHELDTGKRILYVDPRSGERGSIIK